MPEKPTPQFFKEAKKRCPQCGGSLPCSTHGAEIPAGLEYEPRIVKTETLYSVEQERYFVDSAKIKFTKDLAHFALVQHAKETSKKYVVYDGVTEKDGWGAILGNVTLSSLGDRYVYVALDINTEGNHAVIVDTGKKAQTKYYTIDHITQSPDGRGITYIGKVHPDAGDPGIRQDLVFNNKVVAMGNVEPLYCAGDNIMYIEFARTQAGDRQRIVNYGKAGPWFHEIYEKYMSIDGKGSWYVGENTETNVSTLMLDGKAVGRAYQFIADMTPDGKHFGYIAKRKDDAGAMTAELIVDGKHRGGNEYQEANDVKISNDGSRAICLAGYHDLNERKILLGGHEYDFKNMSIEEYGFVGNEAMWITYTGEMAGKHKLFIEGEHIATYDHIYASPQISPDGNIMAYHASNFSHDSKLKGFLMINNHQIPIDYDQFYGLTFSQDSTYLKVAYIKDGTIYKAKIAIKAEETEDISMPSQKHY